MKRLKLSFWTKSKGHCAYKERVDLAAVHANICFKCVQDNGNWNCWKYETVKRTVYCIFSFHALDVPSPTKRKKVLWSAYPIQPAMNTVVYLDCTDKIPNAMTTLAVSKKDFDHLFYTTTLRN